MKSIHIRNVDSAILDALKRLAAINHRSLQGELHYILENAAKKVPRTQEAEMRLVTVNTGIGSTFRREEIYDADGR